jgi:hypothetical protein
MEDFLFYSVGFLLFLVVISNGVLVLMRSKILKKVYGTNKDAYQMIVGEGGKSWIERGYYSPLDIPVVRSLNRAIESSSLVDVIGATENEKYLKIKKLRFFSVLILVFTPITYIAYLLVYYSLLK